MRAFSICHQRLCRGVKDPRKYSKGPKKSNVTLPELHPNSIRRRRSTLITIGWLAGSQVHLSRNLPKAPNLN